MAYGEPDWITYGEDYLTGVREWDFESEQDEQKDEEMEENMEPVRVLIEMDRKKAANLCRLINKTTFRIENQAEAVASYFLKDIVQGLEDSRNIHSKSPVIVSDQQTGVAQDPEPSKMETTLTAKQDWALRQLNKLQIEMLQTSEKLVDEIVGGKEKSVTAIAMALGMLSAEYDSARRRIITVVKTILDEGESEWLKP